MKTRGNRFIWVGIAAIAASCADEVPAGSLLERTRVLALAARPAGDPARAWPRAGEEMALDWLVAAPGQMPPVSWNVAVCIADARGCAGEPFYIDAGQGMPAMRFVAPEADQLLVLASVEPEGEPATNLTFLLPVEHAAVNHHPSLGPLQVAGRPWGDACEPVASGSGDLEVSATTYAADRETYAAADGTETRESLRLSFFATAGKLDGQFRVIEADDPAEAPEAVDKWTPPKAGEVPDGGLEVHFTIVVRDLRGGVSWTTRTLCVSK